jgi:exportin-T
VETWGRNGDKPGFHQYILENIVPACFMAPMKATFDLRDAQTSMVLSEIAACLKAVVAARVNSQMKID